VDLALRGLLDALARRTSSGIDRFIGGIVAVPFLNTERE